MPLTAPAPLVSAPAARAEPSWRRDLGWLLALVTVLYATGLGRPPLNNPDEARYAEIPREMLATGDFVTPRLNGVIYFEKPPLTYWLVAGALGAFGPSEAAARAVPAVFAGLGVLLLYAALRRLEGRDVAWWSAVVLATCLLYFAHARLLLIDMVVSVLISAALLCFPLALREPPGARRRWFLIGLYAAAALATLAKGLIGFLLPGAVMFLWLLAGHQWRRLRPLYLPTGLLLFLAIAAPWHLLVAQRNPQWAWFYFVHEHWLRFTTATHGRDQPWWFFLPVLVAGLFPWTGFLGSGLRRAFAGGWADRVAHADRWYPVMWAGFILLFFSASHSKLVPYALPILPPLAWLVGRRLADLAARPDDRAWRAPVLVSAGLSGLLGAALAVVVARPALLHSVPLAATLAPIVWPAALGLLAGALVGSALLLRRRPVPALAALVAGAAALYWTLVVVSPLIAHPGTRELAAIVAREVDPGDVVLHYHEFFHDFTYYARHEVGTVAAEGELEVDLDPVARTSGRFLPEAGLQALWTGPKRVFLVARRRELPGLMAQPWFRGRILGEDTSHVLLDNHY